MEMERNEYEYAHSTRELMKKKACSISYFSSQLSLHAFHGKRRHLPVKSSEDLLTGNVQHMKSFQKWLILLPPSTHSDE